MSNRRGIIATEDDVMVAAVIPNLRAERFPNWPMTRKGDGEDQLVMNGLADNVVKLFRRPGKLGLGVCPTSWLHGGRLVRSGFNNDARARQSKVHNVPGKE